MRVELFRLDNELNPSDLHLDHSKVMTVVHVRSAHTPPCTLANCGGGCMLYSGMVQVQTGSQHRIHSRKPAKEQDPATAAFFSDGHLAETRDLRAKAASQSSFILGHVQPSSCQEDLKKRDRRAEYLESFENKPDNMSETASPSVRRRPGKRTRSWHCSLF